LQASSGGDVKISVITVCYNCAPVITSTLRSAYLQRYPDVEHIVIDGGSTDGTVAAIDVHRHALAAVLSEPDCGIYDAMNKGLRLVTGDIVGFLNAGDHYAHDNVLRDVALAFSSVEQPECVFGDVAFFRPANPGRIVRRYDSGRFSPQRMAWGWMPAHQAFFALASAYQRVGEFRTDLRIAGDFDWMVRAFNVHHLTYRYVPEILVNMAMGGASTGGLRSTVRLNREVLKACRDNGLASNWLKVLAKYPEKMVEFLRPYLPESRS
jgi:glycosyltransferase involved in cell wall biosynthesis